MKNLKQYAEKCMRQLDELNIPYEHVSEWKTSSRMTRCWGKCTLKKSGKYIITISDRLLQDGVSDFPLENTIIHELLHTGRMRDGHKGDWLRVAQQVTTKTHYQITRCIDFDKFGLTYQPRPDKYEAYCPECGWSVGYSRKGKVVKNIHRYICPRCKTHLQLKEL